MSSLAISAIVLSCVFGATLLGMALRQVLPEHHLSDDSKDTVKLGIGLIGTMGALVLGLMVSSAKNSYDTQKGELTQMSAKIIVLDRTLALYGPEAKEARELLRVAVERIFATIWPDDGVSAAQLYPRSVQAEPFLEQIQGLTPNNENQRRLQAQALGLATEVGQMRWLLYQQAGRSFPTAFLVVVTLWFAVIFLGFGLFAPANPTVIITLLLCSLSLACAVLLVLELDRPFDGLIQISREPLIRALANLGQ